MEKSALLEISKTRPLIVFEFCDEIIIYWIRRIRPSSIAPSKNKSSFFGWCDRIFNYSPWIHSKNEVKYYYSNDLWVKRIIRSVIPLVGCKIVNFCFGSATRTVYRSGGQCWPAIIGQSISSFVVTFWWNDCFKTFSIKPSKMSYNRLKPKLFFGFSDNQKVVKHLYWLFSGRESGGFLEKIFSPKNIFTVLWP